MFNIPEVKLAIVAVSRDCFPITLSQRRRRAVVAECQKLGLNVVEIETTIENEKDTMQALCEVRDSGANALMVFLGNFGPEGPETLLAEKFGGPVMFAAAAEEDISVLRQRARRRFLRHAERQLQPQAARRKGVYSRVPGRHCR